MVDKNFDVQCIDINANPDEVFNFVAEPVNVPKWAIGFSEVNGEMHLWKPQMAK